MLWPSLKLIPVNLSFELMPSHTAAIPYPTVRIYSNTPWSKENSYSTTGVPVVGRHAHNFKDGSSRNPSFGFDHNPCNFQKMIKIIIALLLLFTVYSKKIITFRARQLVQRPIPSSEAERFADWFSQPTIPLEILQLNPGFDRIEALPNEAYRGYLAPLRFPGIAITSIVDFDTSFNGTSLDVQCREGALKQSFQGSKFLESIISRLLPSIQSRSITSFDRDDCCVSTKAELAIGFPVPSWFPLNVEAVEKGGSETIQASMDKDLNGFLDKIVAEYSAQT